ncbi:hypothetical protein ACHAXA_001087 [Cyclostephanos tholiformis]|uniref:Uncharacterized protein n=1 Tax=Cyclostephanos tholiformis TaxID=382380 RepID=A0ABD3RH58_9STRA
MLRTFHLLLLSNSVLLPTSAFSVSYYRCANVGPSLATPSLQRLSARHVEKCDGIIVESDSISRQQRPMATTRRDILARTASSLLIGVSPMGYSPTQSLAADSAVGSAIGRGYEEGMVSQSKLASLLKRIPTFAIVDARGVPYFVVGEDAKLTSYFFLSYGEARRILDVAISSADKAIRETKKEMKAKKVVLTKDDADELEINPWRNARITSVPLDLAVSLASKGKLAGAYFRLAPSESDIEDALAADGSDDLPEGKVPLFYIEDMTITDGGEVVSPLYFHKDQLIADYTRQLMTNKNSNGADGKSIKNLSPNVKVTELFATITEMIRPGGNDEELKTLRFVAPVDSKAKAEQCRRGEEEPFRLGERLIVL